MMSAPPNGSGRMRHQAPRGAVPLPIPRESRVSLRLDAEVLEGLRGQVREHDGGHDPYERLEARLRSRAVRGFAPCRT